VSFTRIVILISFIFLPLRLLSQKDDSVRIDTSEYIPVFYNGALEYNLIVAASAGYAGEIERMILQGAEIDTETQEGATPLIFAVANNRIDAVNTLIYYGADVNKITRASETPLLITVRMQNLEIAEALLRNGAYIDFQDRHGATALHYASAEGYFYIADLLLYYEADVDIKDYEGTTSLMAAVWAGYPDIADLLIQHGANMEARDYDGFTPFLIAAQNGDTLIMNMLLKKGVDLYEKNRFNWDALTLAIKSNQVPATEFLLMKGDKWTSRDREAIEPLSVAIQYRREEIVDILKNHNITGKNRRGPDLMSLSLYSRLNTKNVYTGIGLSFKEPLLNAGFTAGFDTKLWYNKVLIKKDEGLFYQYLDKSSVVYAGLFKDFTVTDNLFRSNISFYTSLSVAYTFGNRFKGTEIIPDAKFRIIPEIGFKWTKENLTVFTYIDYMDTDFHKPIPFWGRIGAEYNFFFDYTKAPAKTIKWY